MTIVHTISDPPAECTAVTSPRLHKREALRTEDSVRSSSRPKSKDLRRKRLHLIEKYGMQCFWCSAALTTQTLTIDHYIPLSRGGSNKIKNLRLSCRICNQNRGNALPSEVRHVR